MLQFINIIKETNNYYFREMCEATEQQLDEEHGLGQLFHNYTKCDDEDAHEIREERRCMYTTYYSSSSSSSLPDSATSSKIDDSSLPDQPQIQMELQLVPQQQQQLKRKYNDIEDPCPEADGNNIICASPLITENTLI